MSKSNRGLHSLHHFLVGISLVLKGSTKVSHHPLIRVIILLFGLVSIGYFFYLLVKKYSSERLNDIIHWFEALASLFTAYVFYQEGAKYLPYVFLLAAIGFFIALFVSHRRKAVASPK